MHARFLQAPFLNKILGAIVTVIELNEISKLYGFGNASTVALDEVNLTVEKGQFVAIMGPSGSGKSTLMNLIGLLDRPTHGEYRLGGQSVAKLRPNQRAKIRRDSVGFIFQSFNLLPRMTALEIVALPLAYRGMSASKRIAQASALLERVGLADREYYLPAQLSGGQMQRVAIARALVSNPDIIIADEPTGNLDSESSRMVMEILSEIHQSGHTILIVTHNPELTRYVDRVVYMHDGVIVHDEVTTIGEVPKLARAAMELFQRKSEDDDLAGVSSLMDVMPGFLSSSSSKKTTAKVPKKPRRIKRRAKK